MEFDNQLQITASTDQLRQSLFEEQGKSRRLQNELDIANSKYIKLPSIYFYVILVILIWVAYNIIGNKDEYIKQMNRNNDLLAFSTSRISIQERNYYALRDTPCESCHLGSQAPYIIKKLSYPQFNAFLTGNKDVGELVRTTELRDLIHYRNIFTFDEKDKNVSKRYISKEKVKDIYDKLYR